MRVVRSAEQREMPWKNGGGSTRELLVHPPGAGLDDFQLRLSRASVVEDGPFSTFPGVERWICVIEGAGMDLDCEGAPLALDPGVFVRFSGDARTSGRLRAGPVRDLNLMLRRPWRAEPMWGAITSVEAALPTVIWLAEGRLTGTAGATFGPGDAAWLLPGEALSGQGFGMVAVIEGVPG